MGEPSALITCSEKSSYKSNDQSIGLYTVRSRARERHSKAQRDRVLGREHG